MIHFKFLPLLFCLVVPFRGFVVRAADPIVLRADAERIVTLLATTARLTGPSVRMNTNTKVAAWWKGPDDRATWNFAIDDAGSYDVNLTWGVPESLAGQRFVLVLDQKTALEGTVPATGGFASFVQRSFGQIHLDKGRHQLVFRPAEAVRGEDLLDLQSIELFPYDPNRPRASTRVIPQAAPLTSPVPGAEKVIISPHTFTIPEGYVLTRAAAAPLVERPIHMSFDESGVLYVTDSSGNTDKAPAQLKNPTHRIVRLVDRDQDGVFDHSTVFAERVPFPEGALWYQGALYVGAPPHILKFRDTDGDHAADERSIWFDGGSIGGCGNDLHGPYLGPDGYFYWCKGEFQRQSHQLSNGKTLNTRAAHVFRAKPDGSELEVVITGGMNNPVGLAFGDTGERFVSGTFFDLSEPGRRDGILHAVYGGVYGKKNDGVLAEHPATGGLLPILSQMGPAAPSGIVMPRNQALGMRGDLLCANFNLRRISRHRLTQSGSTYTAETSTFLESDQSDFHPTDVIEDADGSLLVADTGSWYKICCPTSKVYKPDVMGAIYRIRKAHPSSTKDKDPRGLALDWEQPAIAWLSDERPAVVHRAIEALAKESNIDDLRSADARIPALWALHRIPGLAARKAVRDFLSDENPDVRAAAVHSTGLWRDPAGVMPLIELLASNAALLHRPAAMALGRIGDRRAVKPLMEAASEKADVFLKHAITYALYEIGDTRSLPEEHPLGKQVRLMHQVDQREPPSHLMPDIQLADDVVPDPETLTRQRARLDELAAFLPKGDPKRGAKLFSNVRSLCITCHTKGELGAEFGPDLTRIGAIRSERDLLEAIVFPSASIARYYEWVTVQTEKGETGGLVVKDTIDKLVLAAGPGVEKAVAIQDIKAAKYSNVSLMPAVFDGLLKPEEIADLVAYLKADDDPNAHTAIPPHHPIALPGLHAYAQKSIAAGEAIDFRVSSTVPYTLSVVQLGSDPDHRDSDPVLKTFRVDAPQTQPIHPGSYVHVNNGLADDAPLPSFTLECWVRPFNLKGTQGIITQHDYPNHSGIGLFVHDGRIAFLTGTGGVFDPASYHETSTAVIRARTWHHVAATWDGKTKKIYVDGQPAATIPFSGEVKPGKSPLRIGAYGSGGVAANFFNGDLALCAVHRVALDQDSLEQRVAERGRHTPNGEDLLACWPFTEERGSRVADASGHGHDGQIINRATWMIGGPSFNAAAVGRHDANYDPTNDSQRGHGLRLSTEDLYNCRWKIDHRFQIPVDARSGLYAGRFDFKIDGKPKRYHTTFVVRRPESRAKAPLLVLTSSNTWLAYNSVPFPVNHGPELTSMGTGGLANSHPGAPRYSFYSDHRNGQPTYKVGMKVPWPAGDPNKTYMSNSYSHLVRGERFLHLWLDRHGYDYDVITDHDLHQHPEVLEGYQAVCINGHSEYWSARAYEGLDAYLQGGGSAVVLSGNTMFWRVSFDDTGEVMECRKFGSGIGGRAHAMVGELYHSHDFQRGSLMRFCGYPAWELVGLACVGWSGMNFKPYRVDLPEHFLFNQPHKIALKEGESFGFITPTLGAVGHEYDVRLSTVLKATDTLPPEFQGLAEPEGIVTIASSHDQRNILDFNAAGNKSRFGNDDTIAEIIYWERPRGGRVFHTGSIASAWSMYHDEPLSMLVRNVLHHFGVEPGKDR
ncbi:MAG: putative membrane-bound dehydrogenase-like protein [Verrucomicrobiales bacterium]|jgi:putative membrane-bound dehydrogenase-like protein